MKVKNKVIVVTGGGNGIGRAIVMELLRRKAFVAVVDINEKALIETKEYANEYKDQLATYVLDITKREDVFKLPDLIIKDFKTVDGLINNAGIIQPFIPIKDLDFKKIELIMNVNFFGPLALIKAFLPYFLERKEAHIVNISSMGGFVPVPGQSIYGASKAALKLLSEGLHSELKDTNVGVTTIFPGGVATDIMKNSGAEGTLKTKIDITKTKMKLLTPLKAAVIIVDAMEKNKYRVNAGKDAKMLDLMVRIAPRKAAKIIASKLS